MEEPSVEGGAESEVEDQIPTGSAAEEVFGEDEPFGMEEGEPYAENGRPPVVNMILPAVLCIAVTLAVIFIWSCLKVSMLKRIRRLQVTSWNTVEEVLNQSANSKYDINFDERPSDSHRNEKRSEALFFTRTEAKVLADMELFPYDTKKLFQMCIPSIISIAFLPISILVYRPIVDLFWSPDKFDTPPNINGVISSFLVPAGLVYATAFGFSLQEAHIAQHEFRSWITVYNMTMRQTIITMRHLKGTCDNLKILTLLKDSYIRCCCAIIDHKKDMEEHASSCSEPLFEMVDILYQVKDKKEAVHKRLLDMVLSLQRHVGVLDTGRRCITIFEWVFLVSIGYFSYFGILLLQAQSFLMEMTMCFMTIITISIFSYVLSDLDKPCHGFFKMNLLPMFKVADVLQITYNVINTRQREAGKDNQIRQKTSQGCVVMENLV